MMYGRVDIENDFDARLLSSDSFCSQDTERMRRKTNLVRGKKLHFFDLTTFSGEGMLISITVITAGGCCKKEDSVILPLPTW